MTLARRRTASTSAPTWHTLLLDAAESYDRRRAELEPYGWLAVASLAPTNAANQILAGRAAEEGRHLRRIAELSTPRTWSVHRQTTPPIGPAALRALADAAPARR